ncbi:MAG: hypothetical protein WDO19_22760 [Bacteroidota bacterium]
MASFDEHINQAKSNLLFLTETNSKNNSFWDWQVTTAFYVAVHIVNAHLAHIGNLHYRTHEDVKNAINPYNPLALGKIDETIYLCYAKLEGLSRRSRYLCHDDPANRGTNVHLTYDRHFAKAIRNLDKLLNFFNLNYNLKYTKPKISCSELSKSENFKVFEV